jgi:hypothetical protein
MEPFILELLRENANDLFDDLLTIVARHPRPDLDPGDGPHESSSLK